MKIKDIEEENEALRERVRRLDELYRDSVGEKVGKEKMEASVDGVEQDGVEVRTETPTEPTSKGDQFPS